MQTEQVDMKANLNNKKREEFRVYLIESIEKARQKGLDVTFGDFAENIVTSGLDLPNLPVGTRLKMGDTVILEISQIGKECHKKCAIYYQAGDCIMPREGVFAKVIEGGAISSSDEITIC